MTGYEAALRCILVYHVAAEEYDRTLPGEWMRGEWVPHAGAPMSASLANAGRLRRAAQAACKGVTRRDWQAATEAAEALDYLDKRAMLARYRRKG